MKTIVILTRREGVSAEAFSRSSQPELAAVWKGMAEGAVRAVHGLLEGAGAVLEMETATLDEARRYIEALPYVEEKLLDVQYCALKPFPAFASL
ncbi:MAG: hypothetical protein V4864_25480 [Pseudomonadota bacterium]